MAIIVFIYLTRNKLELYCTDWSFLPERKIYGCKSTKNSTKTLKIRRKYWSCHKKQRCVIRRIRSFVEQIDHINLINVWYTIKYQSLHFSQEEKYRKREKLLIRMPQEYNEQVYTPYFQLYDKMDSERGKSPWKYKTLLLEKNWINADFLRKRNIWICKNT